MAAEMHKAEKKPRRAMHVVIWIAAVLAALVFVGWLGLRVPPAPFPSYPTASAEPSTAPLPAGLPAPVERYFRGLYGERVPVVTSAVVTGRGRIRPFGVWMPARFRFTHAVGRGYRHYIEATWFGLPVLKVNERYVDGKSLFELPFGTSSGPKLEQAANLGVWAELAAAAPSTLLTHPGVSWQPVDDGTALLVVPFAPEGTQTFVVRFDERTGQLRSLEAMRYRDVDSAEKILWLANTVDGAKIPGTKLEAVGEAVWADMGSPWARFVTEELRYNPDVSAYITAKGI